MAYSSARATLGGSDVRKTTKQTRKPPAPPTTVSAITGGRGVRKVARQTSTSSAPTTSPASVSSSGNRARSAPSPVASRRQAEQQRARRLRRVVREIQQPTRAPKPVEKRVQAELTERIKGRAAERISKLKVRVVPKLSEPVKVTKRQIKVSPQTALKAAQKPPQKPQGPAQAKKQPGQKVKRVKARLTQAAKKSEGGLARKLDRGFGPEETITPRQTAIVAESEGLPGITYAQAIAPGESGHKPGVPNPDDATPSLFQITPSVQSAETQAKFDRIASKRPGGYSNPIVAAKQARVLAKGSSDAGVSNYVAFDPSAPQGHLPGGPKAARQKLYGKPKPIPAPLKEKARDVLGAKRTKKVIQKAKAPQSVAPKQGAWMGAKQAVLSVVPKAVRAEGRGDKRTPEENAAVDGSDSSDHLTTNTGAYAADLPDDDALAQKIAKKLGMASHTGTNEVVKGGYRYQLIWQDEGHYDHIHLGASWVGAGAPDSAPVSVGGVTTGGTTTAPSGVAPSAQSVSGTSAAKGVVRKRRRKREQEDKMAKALSLIRQGLPAELPGYEVPTSRESYAEFAKKRPVEVGL